MRPSTSPVSSSGRRRQSVRVIERKVRARQGPATYRAVSRCGCTPTAQAHAGAGDLRGSQHRRSCPRAAAARRGGHQVRPVGLEVSSMRGRDDRDQDARRDEVRSHRRAGCRAETSDLRRGMAKARNAKRPKELAAAEVCAIVGQHRSPSATSPPWQTWLGICGSCHRGPPRGTPRGLPAYARRSAPARWGWIARRSSACCGNKGARAPCSSAICLCDLLRLTAIGSMGAPGSTSAARRPPPAPLESRVGAVIR
jgi:hypothetical protein